MCFCYPVFISIGILLLLISHDDFEGTILSSMYLKHGDHKL